MISWQRPPTDWFCLNTDGSVAGAQGSTAGGVIRDEAGRFVRAFSANLGAGSITYAELAGIAFGLRLAWDEGCRKVKVQTDSATAAQLIHDATPGHIHFVQVATIRELLAREWEVQIDHVFREGNVVADYLASVGYSLPVGVHVFENPSPLLSRWLYFDLLGVQTPRSVII
ncbi:unnamed protein product [Linum tenue]|uniref:RNase H type-1 domain-containing protein n=1 Tax=Linum tenue TaxID=586396 RepID=A0AAV0LM18_9ROSI|nr:unnamed protein product [Linum tenue]